MTDEDRNEFVRSVEEAADAWVRGDMSRYLDLVHHAPRLHPARAQRWAGHPAREPCGWISPFADGEARLEYVETHAWGDTIVLAMIERQHGRIGERPDQDLSIRVNHVYRRDDSDWQLVHRHADPLVTILPPDRLHDLLRR